MEKDDEVLLIAKAAGIVLVCSAVGALIAQAPAGFILGCVAAVLYWRMKDNEAM